MTIENSPFGLRRSGQLFNFNVTSDGDLEICSDAAVGGKTRILIKDREGNGRVGIATKSPSHQLHVRGDIYATGHISSASDQKLKTDIEPLTGSLKKVLEMQAVRFRGNSENYPDKISEGPHIGFIGQDVVDILPEVVFTDDDDDEFLYIDYSRLTPVLTQAIQEQNEVIRKQNAVIEDLLERIEKLEG